ncbi:MAG: Uma2 family endonuclease [Saprospiraceae bacterium]
MSQAAENIPIIKTRKKILNYEDYAALTPADNGNYELHQGKIIYLPSPTPHHQDVAMSLSSRMHVYASANKLGKVFTAPLDTVFDPFTILQPDILYVSKDRFHIIGDKKIEGAPDLVVEVLSISNNPKEMSYKKHIYESFMVREYWLINIKKSTITVYANTDGELLPVGVFENSNEVESQVMPGFKISVQDILGV